MLSRVLSTCFALACLVLVTAADQIPRKQAASSKAFFNAREHQTEYAGPGREAAGPPETDEILIGYFGPDDPAHPEGGDMWRAAQLAVENANGRGGYQGKPFRLVSGWSENPWGTGVVQVTRMVYTDRVWAIIGGIDGPTAHLAEQVAAKARLTVLNPASSDKTVNLANVPWMFSCLPADHLQAPPLAGRISQRLAKKPFVLASANDHDSHLFTVELKKCFAERLIVPKLHFEFERSKPDIGRLVSRIVESEAAATVLVAGADDSARLVAALRKKGFTGPIFGGPWMGRQRFLDRAGAAAEGVIFPLLFDPRKSPSEFAGTFKARFGRNPDYAAAHTYDAVQLLTAAIGKAGLNRARIRDAVRDLSPWTGVTGKVEWDGSGSNTRTVTLGTIRDGRAVPSSGPRVPDESRSR